MKKYTRHYFYYNQFSPFSATLMLEKRTNTCSFPPAIFHSHFYVDVHTFIIEMKIYYLFIFAESENTYRIYRNKDNVFISGIKINWDYYYYYTLMGGK